MEVGGWVQISHGFCFVGKSSQNSPKPVLMFWSSLPCVFSLYIAKSCWIFGIFLTLQRPLQLIRNKYPISTESEMYLFDPYKKCIQSNNETILDQGTPIKSSNAQYKVSMITVQCRLNTTLCYLIHLIINIKDFPIPATKSMIKTTKHDLNELESHPI